MLAGSTRRTQLRLIFASVRWTSESPALASFGVWVHRFAALPRVIRKCFCIGAAFCVLRLNAEPSGDPGDIGPKMGRVALLALLKEPPDTSFAAWSQTSGKCAQKQLDSRLRRVNCCFKPGFVGLRARLL